MRNEADFSRHFSLRLIRQISTRFDYGTNQNTDIERVIIKYTHLSVAIQRSLVSIIKCGRLSRVCEKCGKRATHRQSNEVRFSPTQLSPINVGTPDWRMRWGGGGWGDGGRGWTPQCYYQPSWWSDPTLKWTRRVLFVKWFFGGIVSVVVGMVVRRDLKR